MKNYYFILAISALFLAVGIWQGSNTAEEQRVLSTYRAKPEWKQFVEKIEQDKKVLASGPSQNDRIANTMDIGLQWYVLGEYGRAVEWWKKGLALKVDNEVGWNNLGNAYRLLRRYSDAERAYQQSMAYAKPGETSGCLSLGELYKVDIPDKKADEAKVYFQCLIKHPNDVDLIARLAQYYRDSGDRKNALIYYKKLLDLDPGNSSALEEVDRLR